MAPSTPLVTAEELGRLPRDDRRYELVEGRLIPMSPVGFPHGAVVVNIVVVIDPDTRTVTVWRPSGSPIQLNTGDDRLDLNEVLPGFSCSLEEIFE